MIETIPNPLTDKGVKQDIQDKVNELMERPIRKDLAASMRDAIQRAAEWGMSEGFRMGWRVYETTKGGKR